ncbi:nucleolus and neural progenitor protein [Phasianus colchicus]|uniref:Nucleolus and neural progenitor protein n=1 Tax=Phasianus colchicus TaxID=9054 RepID=A0A669QS81_PHACC|nr:nucleolus and neural progenitor protein [Phasianus colchicus]
MAAPEAAWNRVDVPWPACSGAVAVTAQHPAVSCLPALRRRCVGALKRLSGPGLAAEGRVLRALLYVFHSRLLRHRPYLAMQQVEQCLKRLWKMNLVGCIETLAELIPRKNKAQAQAECLVPSQPMLETVAVKVLGGCKLILRLLDCCCKAFLLSVKHLCSEEFILLNTVASGLLSRLWIQYRCVLRSLISLYGVLSTSLHLVSETQQMPYIKGFTFPSDISSFLGVNLSSEVKKQKAKMLTAKRPTGWLKKLFPTTSEAVSKVGRKRGFVTSASAVKNHSIPADDIGEPVLATRDGRGNQLWFDVKSLLRPSRPPIQGGRCMTSKAFKETSVSLSSSVAKLQHAGPLIQMFQTATSFGELSEALRKAILWCKGNKLKSAAYFLRSKLLKSNRLHHVEAQGCSLQKKLCCVKTTLCKYLLCGSQNTRWPRQFFQRRVKFSKCSKRILKTVQQKHSELFGDHVSSVSPIVRPSSWKGCPIIHTASVKESTAETPKQLLLKESPKSAHKDSVDVDIDSIFAAMGV